MSGFRLLRLCGTTALALASLASLWLGACAASEEAGPVSIRLVGHRGARGLAPENTLAALERAAALGLREVEVDIRRSRDGQLVLFHDATLDRKTNASGPVADHDLASLRRVEIGGWFAQQHPALGAPYRGTRLAGLDQALERYGDRFVWHLEIKSPEEDVPARVLEAIARHGLGQRVVVSSFLLPQLERLQALAPGLPLCLDVGRTAKQVSHERLDPDQAIAAAAERRLQSVVLAVDDLTEPRARAAHEAGLEIRAFHLEKVDELDRLIQLGVEAVTVARPDRAQAYLITRFGS